MRLPDDTTPSEVLEDVKGKHGLRDRLVAEGEDSMSKPESAAVRAMRRIIGEDVIHVASGAEQTLIDTAIAEGVAIIEAEYAAEQPVSQEQRCPECNHGKEWLLDGVCRANVCSISTHGICGHCCEEVPAPVPSDD